MVSQELLERFANCDRFLAKKYLFKNNNKFFFECVNKWNPIYLQLIYSLEQEIINYSSAVNLSIDYVDEGKFMYKYKIVVHGYEGVYVGGDRLEALITAYCQAMEEKNG